MAYFICNKNLPNIEGTLSKIAENQSDLSNLNINPSDYNIIEVTQNDFNNIKNETKLFVSYNEANVITYSNLLIVFGIKEDLDTYINSFKNRINDFLKNNKQHPLFQKWDSYLNQLNNINTSSLNYPIEKSLEQYFNDLGQASLSPLQIP